MKFTKMHGLGNDFVIVEADSDNPVLASGDFARTVCHRHRGIGADGLVIVGPSEKADCRMTIINSDGREAESCGNALRCVAHFAHRRSYGRGNAVTIETLAGIQRAEMLSSHGFTGTVKVDMGQPVLAPEDFPASVSGPGPVLGQEVSTAFGTYQVALVKVGVPHLVIFVDDLDSVELIPEGRALEQHSLFPAGTNVNFVQQLTDSRFAVRVWERGAGETMACGTGACAVAVAAILQGRAQNNVVIVLPGGQLDICWAPGGSILMVGPAVEVFSGEYACQGVAT